MVSVTLGEADVRITWRYRLIGSADLESLGFETMTTRTHKPEIEYFDGGSSNRIMINVIRCALSYLINVEEGSA